MHAKLQLLEKKLRNDIDQFKNQNVNTLYDITNELSLNIRKLSSLINSVKNIGDSHSDTKFDIREIIESLENTLSLPCYFIGERKNLNNIEFMYQDFIDNVDKYFFLNFKDDGNDFRVVLEDELPESYCTALSSEPASDLSAIVDSFSSLSAPSLSSSQLSASTSCKPQSVVDVTVKSNQIEGWIKSTGNNVPAIGDRENVVVSHIDTPESFYIQFNRLENAFQDLSLEIQRYAQMYSLPVKNAELNKLYIVKYSEKWYRARVIDITPEQNGHHLFTIFFIDYGNTTVVTSGCILNISLELSQCAPFAHKCKLFHVYPVAGTWDAKATLHMAKIINDTNVVMVIMAQTNGILEVDLLSVTNVQTTSIRDALIFVGLALAHYDSSSDSQKSKKSKPYTKLHTRTDNFRRGDTLMVQICNVINPHSLYVHVADFVHHLERLTSLMTNYFSKITNKEKMHESRNEHIYVPRKGMVVAVFVNSTWCRATVTKVVKGAGSVTVYLEDYGNVENVDYTKIRKLPDRFRNLECQAIHVKLADVKPVDDVWDVKATEYLRQFIQNKKVLRLLIANSGTVPSVALYEGFGTVEMCVNTALVDEGMAVSTGHITQRLHYAIEEPSSSTKEKEKPYVFNLINTIQSVNSNDDQDSDAEQENVLRKPVKILSVKTPEEIFVEIEDSAIQKMQYELHQMLQGFYIKEKSESRNWEVNDPCVAYNPKNKQYFRGIILGKNDENFFKVMLRDVAEEIVIPETDIYVLQNQFKQFREKAVRCHLANITPAGDKNKWSALAIEFLQKTFEKHTKILMTKSGSIDKNRKSVPVIMWYSETKLDGPLEPAKIVLCNINKLLVKNGLAFNLKSDTLNRSTSSDDKEVPSTSGLSNRSTDSVVQSNVSVIENRALNESQELQKKDLETSSVTAEKKDSVFRTSTPNQKSLPLNDPTPSNTGGITDDETTAKDKEMGDWLPPVPLKSKHFLAIATFVDYNACIYFHESIKEPVLRTMENEMKKYFADTSPEPMDTVWTPGQLCTVKYFVNDNWYRGKIVSVGEDFITVFLIDYGNEEECKHEDLRLKVMYLDLPAFAHKIQLYQVYPNSGCSWLTSDLDELHKKVVENQIHISLRKNAKDASLPLAAVVKLNGVNMNEYMKEYSSNLISNANQNLTDDVYESDDDVIIEHEESLVTQTEPEHDVVVFIQNPLPQHLVGETVKVTIISIINYNEFVLEILINEDIKQTKQLFQEIAKDIVETGEQQPLLENIKVGKPCIAKYSEDNTWYRAEIIDTNNIHAGLVNVWFVDYGNSENVSLEFIRCIKPNWLKLPVLQYKTKIDGIVLSDPSCLDLVLDCMTDYCNTLNKAQIISVNPLCVKLYDNNDQLIYQDLIDQQLLINVD
ncbi:hypothetical protein FQR65_LT04829 [Abscondita terminalis]|nr:hypothetical protein FQR65_LT04829 [Abscondita terminalis]